MAAAEEAFGGTEAVEGELQKRRAKKKKNESSSKPPPLPPPLATLARSLLALASALDAQEGGKKTSEALAVARRSAALDEGAERMAVAPLVEKLRKEAR